MQKNLKSVLCLTVMILFLTVSCGGGETEAPPPPTTVPTLVASPVPQPTGTSPPIATATGEAELLVVHGVEMREFVGTYHGLTHAIYLPAEMVASEFPGGNETSVSYQGSFAKVELYIADLIASGRGEMDFEAYVEANIAQEEQMLIGFELLSSETRTNEQGLPYAFVLFNQDAGVPLTSARLIYVHDDGIALTITYNILADELEELLPIINYSFSTFQIGE